MFAWSGSLLHASAPSPRSFPDTRWSASGGVSHHFGSSIGGIVVDDNHLVRDRAFLFEERIQRELEPIGAVVGAQHHRYVAGCGVRHFRTSRFQRAP